MLLGRKKKVSPKIIANHSKNGEVKSEYEVKSKEDGESKDDVITEDDLKSKKRQIQK